jgi:EamA-like transporter family
MLPFLCFLSRCKDTSGSHLPPSPTVLLAHVCCPLWLLPLARGCQSRTLPSLLRQTDRQTDRPGTPSAPLTRASPTCAGVLPKPQDLPRLAGLGLCLFLNQLFYILGIDWSGVVVATCMQPTIPVFTAMLGVASGLETGSVQKFAGILLAVAGSVMMARARLSVCLSVCPPIHMQLTRTCTGPHIVAVHLPACMTVQSIHPIQKGSGVFYSSARLFSPSIRAGVESLCRLATVGRRRQHERAPHADIAAARWDRRVSVIGGFCRRCWAA